MSEREEYTAETYPSFGKKYNGEKAIISLTSWKARINTVSKTLYSLIKQCPGFHIVLVLSEEEFPKTMNELPENLKVFAENELIEFLWVYKNYKSFKKWIFTADKYKDVPIITADDGCIYIRNYAEELYKNWVNDKNKIISITRFTWKNFEFGGGGCGILFPPSDMTLGIKLLLPIITNSLQDDGFYGVLSYKLGIKWKFCYNTLQEWRKHKTFTDIEIANSTSLWRNKACRNENIDMYAKLLHI